METKNEDILKKYFDSIREEKYKESFDEVESWLRREKEYSHSRPKKSKLAFLKIIFSGGRVKFAYLLIILILAGITSNFSVTRTEPVGIVMSWRVDKQNPESIKKIDNLDWVDKSKLIVIEETENGRQILSYKVLLPDVNNKEVEKLKDELASIKDIYAVNVIPISEPVKQPLYAVALGKVFNVDYDKNFANPEEIKNNVIEQLKLAGIQNDVNLNIVPENPAGKFVNFDFGKKPDSVRIKVHLDAINDYYIQKAIEDADKLLSPVTVINDSISKNTIIKINGETIFPDVIISQVQKKLDTLQFRLKNSESKRKERMEKFNEKMEKFNERMERFNKSMEKYNKKMEKLNEKMKDIKIPKMNYNFDVDEKGDIDIDIEMPDIPDVPIKIKKDFNHKFKFDDLNKDLQINIDTMKIQIDMEKLNKEIKENMEKVKEDMKKLREELKKNKIQIDTSDINIEIDYDDEELE